MAVSLKRKLYSRGGSYETTIPIQLLFSLDLERKHDVIFKYDKKMNRWYVDFEESNESGSGNKNKSKRVNDKHNPKGVQ